MRYNPDNDRSIQDGEDVMWPNATNVAVVATIVVIALLIGYGVYKLWKYGLIKI